ncbi:hypothetical protein R6Q59_024522 [Mikania micrantha]
MMTDKIKIDEFKGLKAVQLSDTHTITVDNEVERTQILSEHPDDPKTIVHGKVKGKLKNCETLKHLIFIWSYNFKRQKELQKHELLQLHINK